VTALEAGSPAVLGAVLGGGVPVRVRHRPGAEVTTVSVWLRAGSRDERGRRGLTHLLEHVLMQAPLPGGDRPVDVVESFGGEANAVTSREFLALYARVPTERAAAAAEVLAAALVNPELAADVVEAETRVVQEELRLAASEPADVAHDVLFGRMFGDHLLGRPVGGTIESVAGAAPGELVAHRDSCLPLAAAVVSGGWPAAEACRSLDEGPLGTVPAGAVPRPDPPPFRGGRADLPLNSDSAAVVLGGAAAALSDPLLPAWHVLLELLAGSNSAPLVEEIRSARGLSYDVSGYVSGYRDTGVWRVSLTTSPDAVDEAVGLAVELLVEQARRSWTAAEVAIARQRVAGLLQLDMESSLEDTVLLGTHALVGGADWTSARALAALAAVRPDDVAACAATIPRGLAIGTAGAVAGGR
jgi:predicted Zn-dependent peptidase